MPGTAPQHKKFEAQMYVLTKEEGGRHTGFMDGYRPQLFTRTGDITCNVALPEGKMVMPGEDATFTVDLISELAVELGSESSVVESAIQAHLREHKGGHRQGDVLHGMPCGHIHRDGGADYLRRVRTGIRSALAGLPGV